MGNRKKFVSIMAEDGFKQLLAAEERAKEIVANVRKERQQILRRAEDEAQADIDAYRAERQKHYDDKLKQHSGNTGERTKKLSAAADKEKADVVAKANQNKEKVVQMLIEAVTTVDIAE